MLNNATLKIFLVDDEVYCLNLFEQYLANLGCKQVFSFNNSIDCLEKLVLQPDLILLDYHMDKFDGIETLKKIKRFNPNTLVVIVSAQEDIKVAVNALKYGAFDYLVKQDADELKFTVLLEKVIHFNDILNRDKKVSKMKKMMAAIGIISVSNLLFKHH